MIRELHNNGFGWGLSPQLGQKLSLSSSSLLTDFDFWSPKIVWWGVCLLWKSPKLFLLPLQQLQWEGWWEWGWLVVDERSVGVLLSISNCPAPRLMTPPCQLSLDNLPQLYFTKTATKNVTQLKVKTNSTKRSKGVCYAKSLLIFYSDSYLSKYPLGRTSRNRCFLNLGIAKISLTPLSPCKWNIKGQQI